MRRVDVALLALLGVALGVPAREFVERWMAIPLGDMGQHLLNAQVVAAELSLGNPLHVLFWTEPAAYPQLGYVLPWLLGARGMAGLCAGPEASTAGGICD